MGYSKIIWSGAVSPMCIAVAMVSPFSGLNAQEGPFLEEVIVTAQKRAQSVQDVPIAITVLSNDVLRERGIDDSFELSLKTPSVVFTQNGTGGQIFIRGVGSSNLSAGSDPSAAVSVDGIYLSRPDGAIQDFYDLERIEVLKGPQGTLYGRNATAGAVNIITVQPTLGEFGGQVQAQYGRFDRSRIEGAVNLPVGETVAIRAAGLYSTRDGFADNVVRGDTEDDFELSSVRFNALFDPGERFTAKLGFEYSEETGSRGSAAQVNPSFFSPAVLAFGGQADTNSRTVFNNFDIDLDSELLRVNATLEYDVGTIILRSITGYVQSDGASLLDLDATNIEFANNLEQTKADTFSQELQILSDYDGNLEWVVGAYFLKDDIEQVFDAFLLGGPTELRYDGTGDVTAYALFGQGTYTVAERFHLTFGLRYSYEEKETEFLNTIVDPFGAITGAPQSAPVVISSTPEDDYSAFTPRFAVRYDLSDNANIFVSATSGFKSGGVNLTGAGEQFDEETLWSYEAGIKATLFDGRVTTNLIGFYYDYQDLQVQFFNGFAEVVENAADATVTGVELSISARPIEDLVLDFGASYLDAKYSNYVTLDPDSGPINPMTGLNVGAIRNLEDNTLPRAPEFVVTAGVDWQLPIEIPGDLHLTADMRYQSEVFFDQFNNSGVSQEGYTLVNLRGSWFSDDGSLRISVFGENVFNESYRSTVIRSTALIGTLDFFGAPETWGVEIALNF